MSEVEALCDRVGILSAGKLIEMGTLAEMRHLSAVSVEATLRRAGPGPVGNTRRELCGNRGSNGSLPNPGGPSSRC